MFESISQNLILFAQNTGNPSRDILVAIIAFGLGLNIFYAALTDNARCFELATVRTIERHFGRSPARFFLVGIGSVCVFLGAFLVAQSTDRKSEVVQSETLNVKGTIEK